MPAIEVEGLVKVFRSRKREVRALDGVDLDVQEGTVLGLLGPNGAGKTTAVRILATLLRPDAGQVTVAGFDVVPQAQERPADHRPVRAVRGGRREPDRPREPAACSAASTTCPSSEATRAPTSCSSGSGSRTRPTASRRPTQVACAAGSTSRSALIGRPRLLFLDEPTTGLDPRSRLGMWDVIRDLVREGATVLLTTQYLEEADELADEIAVVDAGRIIARGHRRRAEVPGRWRAHRGDRPRVGRRCARAAAVLAPDGSASRRRAHPPAHDRRAGRCEPARRGRPRRSTRRSIADRRRRAPPADARRCLPDPHRARGRVQLDAEEEAKKPKQPKEPRKRG